MNESEFCTIIKNSFESQGNFLYKIPDPSSSFNQTISRPFDLIGSLKGKPIAIEVKFLKGLQSFNLKRIEDHQIEALKKYRDSTNFALTKIMLGVHAGRGDYRIYCFDLAEVEKRRNEERNYLKKELKDMKYLVCKKDANKKLYIENPLHPDTIDSN